jgi:hypothetical protein
MGKYTNGRAMPIPQLRKWEGNLRNSQLYS